MSLEHHENAPQASGGLREITSPSSEGLLPPLLAPGRNWESVTVDVEETKRALLQEEDVVPDNRITVADLANSVGYRGDGHFLLTGTDGKQIGILGIYQLSNLLQDLAIAEEYGLKEVTIFQASIEEPVSARVSRMIKGRYWRNLTRQIDEESLPLALVDEKLPQGGKNYLFVPESDVEALDYYQHVAKNKPALNLEVIPFPRNASASFMKALDGKHGLISLALERNEEGKICGVPFVVPGGRFNEMYGWDSYFIASGLLEDGKATLAKSMVDNHLYQLEKYGKILNANRSYYFNRSQPPYTSTFITDVFESLPESPRSLEWLKGALATAMREYREVWMASPRLGPTGLSHFAGDSLGEPVEVEDGHFNWKYEEVAPQLGR